MTKKISVLSTSERARIFGAFPWSDLKGGSIRIDAAWVARNIVTCRLAKANGKGKDVLTSCHHLAKQPLEAAFGELAESGHWRLIDNFDGLWVPRHMTWNSRRGLSSHSWGIAFDLNAARNPYNGGTSAANRTLNETFNRYGFAWGGDWNGAKDSMHWELADVTQVHETLQTTSAEAEPRLVLAIGRGETWSYHAIAGALLNDGHFSVDPSLVAQALGVVPLVAHPSIPTPVPLTAALQALGYQIVTMGDHLHDGADPRYYIFVKPTSEREGNV